MLVKTGLGIGLILILVGAGWYVARAFDKTFISEAACQSRVLQAVQTIKTELEDVRREILELVEKIEAEVEAIPLNVSADVERLCQQAASCRDRGK